MRVTLSPMAQEQPPVTNEDLAQIARWFGENMKAERERSGESQTGLAKKMADLGFPFHQTTIRRIEAGQRPVQLAEALALSTILGQSLGRLTHQPRRLRLIDMLDRHMITVAHALDEVERGTHTALTNRKSLAESIDRARAGGVDDELIRTAERLLHEEPEDYVRKGRDRAELSGEVYAYWEERWDAAHMSDDNNSGENDDGQH